MGNPPMKEVLEHRVWGALLKAALVILPIISPVATGALYYAHSKLGDHQNQITTIQEWRRIHQDISTAALLRVEQLERENSRLSSAISVLDTKLTAISETTRKTADDVTKIMEVIMKDRRYGTDQKNN